jgi:hypothetical protein
MMYREKEQAEVRAFPNLAISIQHWQFRAGLLMLPTSNYSSSSWLNITAKAQ